MILPSRSARLRLLIAVSATLVSCALLRPGPADTVRSFYAAVEKGDFDAALSFVAKELRSSLGEDKLRAGLAEQRRTIQAKKGVSDLSVVEGEVTDQVAKVKVTVTFGDNSSDTEDWKLIKEDGRWRVTANK